VKFFGRSVRKTCQLSELLRISQMILQLLAALLHLGNTTFDVDEDDDSCDINQSCSGEVNPFRTEVYFCHQNQIPKNIGNFTTPLKPHNIGTHLKDIETSVQVVLLFMKSFHFWVSYILYNFLKFSQYIFSLLQTVGIFEKTVYFHQKLCIYPKYNPITNILHSHMYGSKWLVMLRKQFY
jgi:hypothetical protein